MDFHPLSPTSSSARSCCTVSSGWPNRSAGTLSQGLHLFTWTALADATNYEASVSSGSGTVWSCSTNVCSLSVTGDFTSAGHTLAVTAYCTNAVAARTATAAFRQPSRPNLTVWKLAAPFAIDPPSNNAAALECTFRIGRVRDWQQYFISSGHESAAPWALECLRLEWRDDTGAAGTNSASPTGDSLRLDVGEDAQTLTVRLVATQAGGLSRSPKALYLLGWSPAVTFGTNAAFIATDSGPALVTVAGMDNSPTAPGFTVDTAGRPHNAALTSEETAAYLTPFGPNGAAFTGTYVNGMLSGGTFNAGAPGVYSASAPGGGAAAAGDPSGGGGGSQPRPPAPGAGPFTHYVLAPRIIRDYGNFSAGSCPAFPFENLCGRLSRQILYLVGRKPVVARVLLQVGQGLDEFPEEPLFILV